MVAFIVSFIATVTAAFAVHYSSAGKYVEVNGTTFVLYWAFMYYVFNDKNKDE